MILKSSRPLQHSDRADSLKAVGEIYLEIVSLDVGDLLMHAILAGRGFNKSEALRHRLQGDDGSRFGQGSRDLAPTRTDIEHWALTARQHLLKKCGATGIGDDAVQPMILCRITRRHRLAPGSASVQLRNQATQFRRRRIPKAFRPGRGVALAGRKGVIFLLVGEIERKHGGKLTFRLDPKIGSGEHSGYVAAQGADISGDMVLNKIITNPHAAP